MIKSLLLILSQVIQEMKNQNCLSPKKENIQLEYEGSPVKNGGKVPIQLVRELLGLLNAKNVMISDSLDKKLKPYKLDQLIKLQSVQTNIQEEQLKKVKVKLNDIEFQKKKIQQDFAQFRHSSKIQREKEVRKLEDSIQQLKNYMENHKESSVYKLQIMEEKFSIQIHELKEKHQIQIKQTIENLTKKYEDIILKNQKNYQKELQEFKKLHQNEIISLKEAMNQRQNEIKAKHEQQCRATALKNKNIMQNKQKHYESRIIAALSEKKTQEKLHEQTKIQASQIKQKLYNEIYYEKKAKNQLEDQIENKCKFIKNLQKDISDLEVTLSLQKQSYENRITLREKEFAQHQKELNGKYQNQMKTIKRFHYQELNKIQNRIQKIQTTHHERQILWKEQSREIASKLDQRPSKKQDLQIIEQLKIKLNKKQQQSKALIRQLRSKIMQLDNKQETYNRIFTSSNGKRVEKGLLPSKQKPISRESFSRENLFKKSQTTDFKFLLKMCNKQLC